MLVSFLAHTYAIPPHMKERVSRIFILSSANVSSCIMTAIWTDLTNCLALCLLPSKLSGLAALVFLGKWPLVGMLERIACTTNNGALVAVSMESPWASMVQSSRMLLAVLSCMSCWAWL